MLFLNLQDTFTTWASYTETWRLVRLQIIEIHHFCQEPPDASWPAVFSWRTSCWVTEVLNLYSLLKHLCPDDINECVWCISFDSGHLLLSDFGLSRRLRRGGRAFTICGTIQYMGEERFCFHKKRKMFCLFGDKAYAKCIKFTQLSSMDMWQ